jgi:hypothetical protein
MQPVSRKRRGGKLRNPRPKKIQKLNVERTEHPPQLNDYQVVHGTTLRFTSVAAATNTAITAADLLDTMLVASAAVVGSDLFDVVKIKKIEIWGQAALGTPSTVEVAFINPNGDNNVHTDTSLGVRPAYVAARPSRLSLASFFQVSTATAVFSLTCPAGSIIDVHLTFRTSSAAPVTVQNLLVGATVGEFYFRGLDGLAIAGTNFPPPVGVPRQ